MATEESAKTFSTIAESHKGKINPFSGVYSMMPSHYTDILGNEQDLTTDSYLANTFDKENPVSVSSSDVVGRDSAKNANQKGKAGMDNMQETLKNLMDIFGGRKGVQIPNSPFTQHYGPGGASWQTFRASPSQHFGTSIGGLGKQAEVITENPDKPSMGRLEKFYQQNPQIPHN